MKVTQATLEALFSQEDDSSFSAYLAMETKTSSRVADLFDDLNKGDHSLAALAIDSDSKPIVVLDGYLSNHKNIQKRIGSIVESLMTFVSREKENSP